MITKFVATVFFLLCAISAVFAGQAEDPDVAADMATLKQGQAAIQQELREIKKLLLAQKGPAPAADN